MSNPYESPRHVEAPTKGASGTTVWGLLILAASVVATTVVNIIRLPYADEVRIVAAVGSIAGAVLVFNKMSPLVRVPAVAGICGFLVGYGAALATLFIPPPPGGQLLFSGLDGAIGALFIVSGAVAIFVGIMQSLAEAGIWMLNQLLHWLRKSRPGA